MGVGGTACNVSCKDVQWIARPGEGPRRHLRRDVDVGPGGDPRDLDPVGEGGGGGLGPAGPAVLGAGVVVVRVVVVARVVVVR